MPRIVIIAGEASGDQLGRGLIEALRRHYPDAVFEGITGPQMASAGCLSWGSYEQLAVMGISEVIRHLPRLRRLKKHLQQRLSENPPDVLIGIDAPDFNLRLEKFARSAGIPTVHYVCPSVWAWRSGRVKTIRQACDLVLCLLPFEAGFVAEHGINARFVGHPLADEIQPQADKTAVRQTLGMSSAPTVALLPGSRVGELQRLGGCFLEAAAWLRERNPAVQFISAAASPLTAELFATQCQAAGLANDGANGNGVRIVTGGARQVVAAADVVLLASGTATLETMLLHRPMVVAYRVAPLTAWFFRVTGLIKIKYFALPNLLAGSELVPEFIQEAATGPALGAAVQQLLKPGAQQEEMLRRFTELGDGLRKSASDEAAAAVAELLAKHSEVDSMA